MRRSPALRALGFRRQGDDEVLLDVEILLPREGLDNYFYQKVGARNALIGALVGLAIIGLADVIIVAIIRGFL